MKNDLSKFIPSGVREEYPGYKRNIRGTRGISGVREEYPGYERNIWGTRGISGVQEEYPGYERIRISRMCMYEYPGCL